ncbi:hypothetical protein KN815_09115 [Streptomyces sp. 4503]|uniref:Transposase n=1 Tax=Streptomyces niphimycinicus TaxID=2842201 RepID=A0ABS6CBG1_9ACTN|nr:hypothetical protein [Streptomyces niphimycinicus]MBU3864229.1 hypothetical protein [Streptomyces niphimycinicus]
MRAVAALIKERRVLEFQWVLLTGVSDGRIPHQRLERYRLTCPDRHRQEEQRTKARVFVAATHTRDELVVTWSGRPSRFLPEDATRRANNAAELLSPDGPWQGRWPDGGSGRNPCKARVFDRHPGQSTR